MGRKSKGFQWVREDQPDQALVPPGRRDREFDRAEAFALDDLALRLAALSPGQRSWLDLGDELEAEVAMLAALAGKTAHRRQLIRVQGLLRDADPQAIEAAMAAGSPGEQAARARERWRSRLVQGDDQDLQAFLDTFPSADRQQLRTLVRQARGEGPAAASAFRRLFRAIAQADQGEAPPEDEGERPSR